jgi:hypothetical protein
MKSIYFLIATILCCSNLNAQVNVSKSYNTDNIKKVKIVFDYPKLVQLKTWSKNEIGLEAKVSINDGLNNDAFVISESTADDVLSIKGTIKDVSSLPRKFSILSGSSKTTFKSIEELKKYQKENNLNTNFNYSSNVDVEITVTVFIPEKLATEVTCTYGLIEVQDFAAPLKATSPYKGVDVVIAKENIGKLSATTSYGEILTDVNFDIIEKENKDFYTYFKANVGNGFNYTLSSTYGKLYLRKK